MSLAYTRGGISWQRESPAPPRAILGWIGGAAGTGTLPLLPEPSGPSLTGQLPLALCPPSAPQRGELAERGSRLSQH